MDWSYYGWRIVAALAVTQTLGYGVLYYAFGVLVTPMEAELGWTRAQTSGAFSLGLLVSGLAAVPVGRLTDRRGARVLMTLGSLAGALLVFAWAHVQTLTALYLVWFGIGLAMSAVLYEVAFTVVAVWFRKQRASATFAITLVAGLASTIFIPLTTWLLEQFDWRGALKVLAIILAVGTLPLHALVLRRSPGVLGLAVDGGNDRATLQNTSEVRVGTRAALSGAAFWWLWGAFALARFAFAAMGAHLVPLLLERGYSAGFVALAVGAIGPLQLLGRVVFAPALTRWSLVAVTAAMFACLGLGFLALLLPGTVGVWTFVALYGASNGASTLSRSELIAQRYGSGSYGSINGVLALVVAVVSALAPLLVGVVYAAGGYSVVLWGLALGGFVAAAAVQQARVPLQRKAAEG